MLLSMNADSSTGQTPARKVLLKRREPSLRSRAYQPFRAAQLLEENKHLNLPALGGFVQSFVDLEAGADRESQLWGVRAGRYSGLYVLLGLPAAVLAAVAGVTVLASTAGRLAAGFIALASAALSAGATFLDSAKKRDQSARLNADWEALYNEMRVCRLTKLASFTTDDGPVVLTSFAARAAAIRAGRDSTQPGTGAAPQMNAKPLFFRVPNVVGLPPSRAQDEMRRADLQVEIQVIDGAWRPWLAEDDESSASRKPRVVSQDVRAGTPVPEGTVVRASVVVPPPMTDV
jgi:hypothetical protein